MPGLDGHAACAQIRLLLADDALPIVMLTAADDIASIETAFEAGATDFITKPISWPLLRERVRYALRAGNLTRQVRRAQLRELSVRRIAGLGYWEWLLSSDRLSWSEEFEPLAGIRAQDSVPREEFLARVHPDDRQRLHHAMERARDVGARLDQEFRIHLQSSDRILRVVGERGLHGEDADRVFGVFQDLTSIRRTEALVDYLSLHDETTDLPNRRLFLRRAAERIQKVRAENDRVLLIGTIDIHRFARFNESLGEGGANRLLALWGQRLKHHQDGGTVVEVARVGGDEFAVAIQATDGAAASAVFRRVQQALRQPVHLEQQELVVPFSAGWAVCPTHGHEAEPLLTLAQEAQRRARAQGRDDLGAEADDALSQRRQRLLAFERALHRALERQEFYLAYQPQMDVATGRIVGCEALIRWRSTEWGEVSPAEFVPLLEESGAIIDVGAWVLASAAQQAAAWERRTAPAGGHQPVAAAVFGPVADGAHPVRAAIVRCVARVHRAGNHRKPHHAGRRSFDPPVAALPRCGRHGGHRRLRGRPFVAGLCPAVPHRCDQDRPRFRHPHHTRTRRPRHRAGSGRPRAVLGRGDHRGRRGDSAPVRLSGGHWRHPGAGLPDRPPDAAGPARSAGAQLPPRGLTARVMPAPMPVLQAMSPVCTPKRPWRRSSK